MQPIPFYGDVWVSGNLQISGGVYLHGQEADQRYTLSGTGGGGTPAAATSRVMVFSTSSVAGLQSTLYYENISPNTQYLQSARLVAATPPSVGICTMNIFRQTSGYTNPEGTGTTVLTTPGTDLAIQPGLRVGRHNKGFAISGIAPGQSLNFNLTAVSGADLIVLYLEIL